MFTLPNGRAIDEDMLEVAMEDGDLTHRYYLNTQTGEVAFFSDYDDSDTAEEEEALDMDVYIHIERIPSNEAYQWMRDFIDEVVEPKDERVAEKLSIAIMGRGAFGRFKDVLHSSGGEWTQAWYQRKDDHLHKTMQEWLEQLSI